MMKLIALLCVVAIAYVCYHQFTLTFPRETGKWPQTLYDRELAYCTVHDSVKNCRCAVEKTEEAIPYDEAMGMEQKAGESAASDPIFRRVLMAFSDCGMRAVTLPVQFDPAARKGSVVNEGEGEHGRNGESHGVKYDPKTGTWSN